MSYKNLSRTRMYRLSTPVRLGVAAVAACFLAAPVLSNPVNPTVVNGTATFNQAGNVLTVTNSNGAIINWDKFSIAAGEKTHFAQTSASSSVLNRVLNDPSAIYGTLSSNGRVWLINPAGIMVGASGRIDTAAFVASTLNIRNEDFLAGRHLFINDGTGKDVINQGEIRTPAGGSVYLIGNNVTNEGIITTPKGETILAAGATVSLIDSALPGVKVDITGATGNATNLGEITAEAGRIGIAGVIVRNSGTLNASSVVADGGRIFLKASQDAYVDGNGRIVTTGTKGGSVEVLGNRVAVMDHASIDASGTNGGGTIKVGGDYQGKNPDIQNANITYFGPNASLKADATEVGAGGTVIVWADDTTRAYGSISARGGALGGNGGFVETSGHRFLDVAGARVDTRAAFGQVGNWLLDPADVTINDYGGYPTSGGLTFPFAASTTPSIIYAEDISASLASTGVTIQAGTNTTTYAGSVYLSNAHISSASSNTAYGLSIYAYGGNINLYNSSIALNGGSVSMFAGWDGTGTTINSSINIDYMSSINSTLGNVNLQAGGSLWLAGNGSIQAGQNVNIYAGSSSSGSFNAWRSSASVGNITAGVAATVRSSGTILNNYYGPITAPSVTLFSKYGTATPGSLAISANTAATNITASVDTTATYGGISIWNTGSATGQVRLTDYSTYTPVCDPYSGGCYYWNGIQFSASGNFTVGTDDRFITNHGNIYVWSSGTLSFSGALSNTHIYAPNSTDTYNAATGYWTSTPGGAQFGGAAGISVPAGSSINVSTDLSLNGGTVNINGPVTSSAGYLDILGGYYYAGTQVSDINITANLSANKGLYVIGGGNVNITNATLQSTSGGVYLNSGSWWWGYYYGSGSTGTLTLDNARIYSPAAGTMQTYTYDMYDPYLVTLGGYTEHWAENGINISSNGDFVLKNGSRIEAPNADVAMRLWGPDSMLYVGKAGDSAPSYVLAKATTTYIDFTSRATADGILINDVAGLTTRVGSSGFFAGSLSNPASPGNGLVVAHSGQSTAAVDICASSPDLCNPKPPAGNPLDEPPPTFEIVGPGGTQPGSGGGSTAGGTEDSFGGDEGKDEKKDEKDDKDKKSDQAKDEKKDDKPGQKKVAQCS